jgi:hypothetical protein
MDTQPSPPVKMFLPAALIMAIIGWGGLIFLIVFTLPTVGPRWLFFFTSVLALTGTILPFIAYLHLRFPGKPTVTSSIILRQAILIGVYLPTLAWLQIGRMLTVGLAILLAVGLTLLEVILRMRERSQWKP